MTRANNTRAKDFSNAVANAVPNAIPPNKVGRLSIPKTDFLLDGIRRLRYVGAQAAMPMGGLENQTQHVWKETEGGDLLVIASLDQTHFGPLLHVSFSHPKKLPTWDEVRQLKDLFFPEDVDAMQVLPKQADYINVHKYTLHLWQMPFAWGIQ